MRDIDIKTRLSAHSFVKWRSGNTSVEVGKIYDGWTDEEKGIYSSVYLHDNFIYEKRELYDGTGRDELFTMSGWNSATTRSRLNALLDGARRELEGSGVGDNEPFYEITDFPYCGCPVEYVSVFVAEDGETYGEFADRIYEFTRGHNEPSMRQILDACWVEEVEE